MYEFLWGSIGRKLSAENPGQLVKGLGYGLRKPQFDSIVDADIGRRLSAGQIANIRKLALSKGIPETRVAPGFEHNLMLFTGSTEGRDRYGDRIAVDGWRTNEFKLNPVFLGFHDYEAPAIGQALDVYTDTVDAKTGKSAPNVKGANSQLMKRLRFLILWAVDTNPMAKILHGLYRDKDMRASSVGFIPEEVQVPADDDERSAMDLGPFGVYHKEQTLLELSAVSVPALPGAVADQYLDDYRQALPDSEAAGLRKLAEQLKSLDAELSKAIRSVLPSATRQFDFSRAAEASKEARAIAEAAKKAADAAKEISLPSPEVRGRVIPQSISNELAPRGTSWSAPSLSDFGISSWADATSAEKIRVARHYTWAESLPPKTFTAGLALPHHRASDGKVVFNGLAAAAARLNQTDLPTAEMSGAKAHLRRHYNDFGAEPPESIRATEEELVELVGLMQAQGKDVDIPDHMSLDEKAEWVLSILDPQGGQEQTDPAPNATVPGDKLSDMDSVLATIGTLGETKDEATNRGVSPPDVSSELAPPETPFDPETLSAENFDFDALDEAQRTLVAGFFAWAAEIPPTSFEQLALGHHNREDGYVNLEGVRAAMGDLLAGRSNVPDEDRRMAYDHLANHFEQFDEEAPAFSEQPTEEASFEECWGERLGQETNQSPALAGLKDSDLDSAIASKVEAYKRQLVSEVSEQLGIDISVEEKGGGERKWRVVRAHKPRMADVEDDFSRADFEAAVGNNFDMRRECSLIYDANDQKNPRSYIGQHHKAEEGTPVVWKKVRSTMRLLLSKAFDGSISDAVRKRGFFHLRTHYDQFEQAPPSFRSVEHLVALGSFLRSMSLELTDNDPQVREAAEVTLDMVFMGYQNAAESAFEIQSLKFPKRNWDREAAREYVRERGYAVDHVVETDTAFLFEQRAQDEFLRLDERTHDEESDAVVLAVGGKLRSGVGLIAEKVDAMKREFQAELRKLREQLGIKGSPNTVRSLLPLPNNGQAEETYAKIYEESASIARELKGAVGELAEKK